MESGLLLSVPSASLPAPSLLHPSSSTRAGDRARHQAFITQKLTISGLALIVAPFFLAYRGAPTPVESVVFAFALIIPLAAAVIVARAGAITLGHALVCAGLLALSVVLSMGTSVGVGASLAWIILAQWEASLAGDRRLKFICGGFAYCALALVATHASHVSDVPPLSAVWFGGLALAYALTSSPIASNDDGGDTIESDCARSTLSLAALSEALGDVVVGFDAGGSVDGVWGGCEHLLGVPPSDLFGRGLFQIVHVADRPSFLKLIADATHGEISDALTIRVRTKVDLDATGVADPRFLWVEMRARAIRGPGRANARTLAIFRDVTAHYQNELETKAARRSIEMSVRSKDDFLANMSHELRTPLNAIIGFSEMLASLTLRPVEPAKQREYAMIIHQSGQHLLSVVNSILDMSKIQSGTFAIIAEPFALPALIDQCCDILRLKAQEGRIKLVRDYPDSLDEIVGDRRACKQILINLVSNAVKFTPADGEVCVSARPEGNSVLIIVSDTGIGISADDLARIGDPFFQARGSFDRPFEGTGLGLSVVRGLLGLHGGTMTIESEPAKGTSVTIRLPLDCQTISDRPKTPKIETISRYKTAKSLSRVTEPRIKSIA